MKGIPGKHGNPRHAKKSVALFFVLQKRLQSEKAWAFFLKQKTRNFRSGFPFAENEELSIILFI